MLTSGQSTLEAKSLTAAWLRQVRLQRSITRVWLSQQLNVNQTKLWRCESQNQTLPPGWLPTLRRLGFLPPSPSKAEPSYARFEAPHVVLPRSWWPTLRQVGPRLPATLPVPNTPPTPASGSPDGAWLAKERKRLAISEYDACYALRSTQRMLRRVEREAVVAEGLDCQGPRTRHRGRDPLRPAQPSRQDITSEQSDPQIESDIG